ncbi:MAG: hypothetical protein JSS12_11065 [Verrucomicrobia bacterium]|nr:hypothetical protein [Verrucomicrobiota bacterium]
MNILICTLALGCLCSTVGYASSSSNSSSSSFQHTYTHPIVLDLEDGFWNGFTDDECNSVDNSISTQLQITQKGSKVQIKLPQLNFTIPTTADSCYENAGSVPPPAGGYLYLRDGFLPTEIRPDTVVPLTFSIQADNYELQIDREGRIKISGPNFSPLAPGSYNLTPTIVSYIAANHFQNPPKNMPISKTLSTPNAMTFPGQFMDLQQSSFYDDVVAFTYANNSVHPDQPSCYAAVGNIIYRQGIPTISLTSNQVAVQPDPFVYGYCVVGAGSGITINPADKDNIVLMTPQFNNVPLTDAFPYDSNNIITTYSNDGGKTWSPQVRLETTALEAMRTSPRISTDSVGNHWIIYGNRGPLYDASTDTGTSINICASSDGGQTWQQVAEVLPPNTNGFGFDYPSLHWGGDGLGGVAMYFSWTFRDVNSSNEAIFSNYIAAIPVNGLGSFGSITVLNNFPQLDGIVAFGEIMATPDAYVVYAASDVAERSGFGVTPNGLEAHTSLSVLTGGYGNFEADNFSDLRLIDYTTIGMNNSVDQHNVIWQATEGIRPSIGTQGLAYDPNSGRLYALSETESNPQTIADSSAEASKHYNKGQLNLRWSTDFGQTWSEVIPIRDCEIGQTGDCSLTVDPKTGNIAAGWYDPRDDAKDQQKIRWYSTVLFKP